MAEKGFGVKEVNLIGASGTPTITSPNNLNLNAVNVAISTNVSIGGTLSVTGNISIGGTLTYEDVTNIESVGLVTAREGIFIPDSKELKLGKTASSPDLKIFHDGSNSYIKDDGTGELRLQSNILAIQNTDGTNGAVFYGDGASELMHNGSVKLATASGGVTVTGTLTATTFSGSGASLTSLPAANLTGTLPAISGANLTNLPATDPTNSDIQVVYNVTANGASAYRFAGNGVVSTADNPDLYFIRGQKYRFVNNSGGSHPFQIRESSGGTAYSTGVTNNGAASGNIDFAPTYDSPAQLVYQCTSHSGMVGNIYLRDAAGTNTNVGVTTFSGSVTVGYDTTYSPIQQAASTYFYTRADQASSVSGSNIQNLATGSLKISETIPISNMTRQSDAGAHSFYNSSSTSGSVTRDMTAGNPFAPKSYGLTMGTMFYTHTSGNNGSGVIHYGWTPTNHHFFVRYKYNSNSILVGADTDGSDNWSTAYQNDLMSDSNWYFFVVAVERNGTLLTSLNGAPLTPIRMLGTAPEPTDARFGLAGDGYTDNDSRHRYATAFWYRGVMSNELIAQEYAWLKTIWTGASLP